MAIIPISFRKENFDQSVRPQDDFFTFACGGWLKKNPIPDEESQWGTFNIVRKNTDFQLKEVVEHVVLDTAAPYGSPRQLVRDFWVSGMNEKHRDALGFSPMQEMLAAIDTIHDATDLARFLAIAHMRGISAFWRVYTDVDEKQSDRVVLWVYQSGLTLPDRDFYLKTDPHFEKTRKAYRVHIKAMATLAGVPPREVRHMKDAVERIEMTLAKASFTRTECRDIERMYNKRTQRKLKRESPNIDWDAYFAGIGCLDIQEVIVGQPQFMQCVDTLCGESDLADIRAYLKWRVIDDMAPLLTTGMYKQFFAFHGAVLNGAKDMLPVWRRVMRNMNDAIGDAVGQLYVEKFFPKDAQKKIDRLVTHLIAAYGDRIQNLDWMSAATKKKALLKLSKIDRKIGYPKEWRKYRGLVIHPEDYVGNTFRAREMEFRRQAQRIGKKPNKNEWHTTAQTVNAYYNYNLNCITFPAGILQPPFFDVHADDAFNYGAIGAVIGHELTHGFDDMGSKYDAYGNLKNWWTARDRASFAKKSAVFIKQFDSYEASPGMYVNGKLTLGENIADLGGLHIAFDAFRKTLAMKKRQIVDDLTPEQRFFVGYCMFEAGSIRPALLKQRLITDTHSPSIARVNIPLSNMQEFYDAFDVTSSDAMYRKPIDRVKIW